jgi:hypothetical protein
MTDQQLPDPLMPTEAPKKRPASQYYWGDWWKDKGLHSCSLAARGLWHEMNCLMHEGEPYGHLTLNGRPMTVAQLANQCRISAPQCKKLLDELAAAGVPSETTDGVLFSRRMVRDEAIRNARAAGGKDGAEHGIKGAEAGSKGGRPKGSKGGQKTPLDDRGKPPPSSSSSSSASASQPPVGGKRRAAADPPPDCPDDVEPDTWRDWLAHRKAKRATVTATVLAEARTEAAKAGLTLDRFLAIWCARGTQGLQADWLKPHERGAATNVQRTFREIDEANAAADAARWSGGLAARKPNRVEPVADVEVVHGTAVKRLG